MADPIDISVAAPANPPRVHLVVPTHTTRHLASCLASIALQTRPPDTVTITCDVDRGDISAELDAWWPRIAAVITDLDRPVPVVRHVFRPHTGVARLNQVRNNALRALDAAGELRDVDVVVVLDGDTLLGAHSCVGHFTLGGHFAHDLIIPYRMNLDPAATEPITPAAVLDLAATLRTLDERDWGVHPPLSVPADTHRLLRARQVRYQRQLWLRDHLPLLTKTHKPKVLGGHHAVGVRALRAVNGYDERFTGYGYDDDDLSRRLHALRPPARTAIAMNILAFHLWHPTRAPARPTDAPGYATFRAPWRPCCEHGWRTPTDQPEVRTRELSPRV